MLFHLYLLGKVSKKRLLGTARVLVYGTVVTAGLGALTVRNAVADTETRSLELGRKLAGLQDLLHGAQEFRLNGQSVYFSATESDDSVSKVLDRFENHCNSSHAFEALKWKSLGDVKGQDMEKAGVSRFGVVRKEDETAHDGVVMCFTKDNGPKDFLTALDAFRVSGDLHDLGDVRYVHAVRRDSNTYIQVMWTEGSFNIRNIMGTPGEDSVGSDFANIPRPIALDAHDHGRSAQHAVLRARVRVERRARRDSRCVLEQAPLGGLVVGDLAGCRNGQDGSRRSHLHPTGVGGAGSRLGHQKQRQRQDDDRRGIGRPDTVRRPTAHCGAPMKRVVLLVALMLMVVGIPTANAQQQQVQPIPEVPKPDHPLPLLRFPAPAATYDLYVQYWLQLIRTAGQRYHVGPGETDKVVLLVKDCAMRVEADGYVTQGEARDCRVMAMTKMHEIATPYIVQAAAGKLTSRAAFILALVAACNEAPKPTATDASIATATPSSASAVVDSGASAVIVDAEADVDVAALMERGLVLLEDAATSCTPTSAIATRWPIVWKSIAQKHLDGVAQVETMYEQKHETERKQIQPQFRKRFKAAWANIRPGIDEMQGHAEGESRHPRDLGRHRRPTLVNSERADHHLVVAAQAISAWPRGAPRRRSRR